MIITDNILITGIIGCTVRQLIALQVARSKHINTEKGFVVRKYTSDNAIPITIGYLCTMVFVYMVPEVLSFFGKPRNWNGLVAFGCGFSSMELLNLLKSFITKKIGNFKNLGIVLMVLAIGMSSCKTQEQKDAKNLKTILKRNPAWITTKHDTVIKHDTMPGFSIKEVMDMQLDSYTMEITAQNLSDRLIELLNENKDNIGKLKSELTDAEYIKNLILDNLQPVAVRLVNLPEYTLDTLGVKVIVSVYDGKLNCQVTLQPKPFTSYTFTTANTLKDNIKIECNEWYWKFIAISMTILFILTLLYILIFKK